MVVRPKNNCRDHRDPVRSWQGRQQSPRGSLWPLRPGQVAYSTHRI